MNKLSIKEFTIGEIISLDNLVIPNFQRKMVWKNELRQDLIYSMTNDYPIGAITLFKNDGKYYLIDGLQRITTLKVFIEKPKEIYGWNRLRKEKFFNEEFEKIINNENYSNKKKIELKKGIKKWYEEDFDGNLSLVTKFFKYMPDDMELEEQEKIYNVLNNIFSLNTVKVPVIIYKGQWSEAAEIFEKMNSGSVTLSKYEIYAATWSTYRVSKLNDELSQYLDYKYRQIENLDIGKNDQETLFELFLANSYKLCHVNHINYLIPKMKKNDNSRNNGLFIEYTKDELFFDIVSTLFTNDPQKIYKVILEYFVDGDEENNLKDGIEDLLLEIANIIKEIIYELVQELTNDKITIKAYYQTIYNIATRFKCCYNLDLNRLEVTPKRVRSYIPTSIAKQIEENWFVGENRQKTFLTGKLSEIDDFIKKI